VPRTLFRAYAFELIYSRHMQTPASLRRWNYSGNATPERLAALMTGLLLPELVSRLKNEGNIACFHPEPRHGDRSYSRAVFCIVVTSELFDLVFNAQTGYRGAYFESPDVGLRANRAIIDGLSPILIRWAVEHCPGENQNWIAESLSLASAKIWLAEEPLSRCPRCRGEWSHSYVSALQIVNSRWDVAEHTHAVWGRQAPEFTKLRIFGAFVNAQHREWIAAHKTDRAMQICKHGWS